MVMGVYDMSVDATVYWEKDSRAFSGGLLLDETSTSQLIRTSGTRAAVFKTMNEMHDALKWLAAYPELRIIGMVRSYADVVNSSVRLFSSMRESLGRIVNDREDAGWWGGGISDENFALVKEYYHPEMKLEDAYALFWIIRNSLYFDLSLYDHPQVKICKYEHLVSAPDAQFREIFAFTGTPYKSSYTRKIFDSSVGKNQSPELDPEIDRRCREMMLRLGYVSQQGESGVIFVPG